MLEMINSVFPALPRWSVLLGGDQIESLGLLVEVDRLVNEDQ